MLSAAAHVLPPDLTLVQLDGTSPAAHLAALAELPSCGEVLRGLLKPAVCLVAFDRDGRAVSCAAASGFAHEGHPTLGGQAWWGMLATDPTRRGERLALIPGAHAIQRMAAQFGTQDFMTGIEPGNAPSEAVCTRLRLAPGPCAIMGCADPQALAGGRMTK